MIKFVVTLIIAILLAIGERSLRPFLPFWLEGRALLPVLLLIWMSLGRRKTLIIAVIAGAFYDVLSVGYPDLAVLRLPLTVLLVDFIQHQWLTNRSLIATLGIMVIGRGFELMSTWIVQALAYAINATPYAWNSQPHLVVVLVWDLAIVSVGFLLTVGMGKRFFNL